MVIWCVSWALPFGSRMTIFAWAFGLVHCRTKDADRDPSSTKAVAPGLWGHFPQIAGHGMDGGMGDDVLMEIGKGFRQLRGIR
jgi:hypothetical protein